MRKRRVPLARPKIDLRVLERIEEILESGQLVQGTMVKEFEKRFSEFNGVRASIAVNSGTAALQVALAALGLKPGEEVITTPFTFIATSNSVISLGGIPIFVDVNPKTYNLDPEKLEVAITNKTRGIIPVHLFGLPCEMDRIMEIARKHDLFVLEDAAQAIGAKYREKMVGRFGNAATYSFYATKNITTGEGGMIVTNDPEVEERARQIRDQGQDGKYNHVLLGFNSRMTEITAAIGLDQLESIEELNSRRRNNADFLNAILAGIPGFSRPYVPDDVEHVYHLYAAKMDATTLRCDREKALRILNGEGIGARPVYPLPIYKQPLYRSLCEADRNPFGPVVDFPSYVDVRCPLTEELVETLLLLPVHPGLSDDDLDAIRLALRKI
ncbi:DegT/DnrJ/EryC1/StrS family aminotransferase [Candidatus Bathyarchaeota archaeon]|nr:DegT/DnrJ/EryC1/StrS family aminotransferase [Candidatus Bathyarchaeota archaeon]